jgi:hypothetical protein
MTCLVYVPHERTIFSQVLGTRRWYVFHWFVIRCILYIHPVIQRSDAVLVVHFVIASLPVRYGCGSSCSRQVFFLEDRLVRLVCLIDEIVSIPSLASQIETTSCFDFSTKVTPWRIISIAVTSVVLMMPIAIKSSIIVNAWWRDGCICIILLCIFLGSRKQVITIQYSQQKHNTSHRSNQSKYSLHSCFKTIILNTQSTCYWHNYKS